MDQTIRVNCPSCGSTAPHSQKDHDFTCEYCGTRFQVKTSSGNIELAPLINTVNDLKFGMDRTGSEMAIRRIKDEINELQASIRPFLPEYERLKQVIENPGLPLKFLKYWWIGIVAGFALFFIAALNDWYSLVTIGFFIFVISIFMYILAAKKAIKLKGLSKRYEELVRFIVPVRETISRKSEVMRRYQEIVDN